MRERHSDGYALAWVIIIMMILFLFLGAAMSFAAGNYFRTQADHAKKQAALTARTLSRALAEDFVNHPDREGGFAESMLSQKEFETEDVISTEALSVGGLDPSLGICTVKAVYQRDLEMITLTVKCILEGEEEIVSVELRNETDSRLIYDWNIMGYKEGEDFEDELEKNNE